ncbi:FG-GAP-like repeat-containing protein [Tautonia sociabilis]|uniref:Tetratricopeptide repeat protein n=1 Tax=Tautonia sociabilis TaxID=2080755 RepID=A0A432MNA9_9BACT|nr:FG-GAP-like repeat-containing protein [Tautonia sociabilis]RUL88596.1 tetratricopeptide repeat protein [Tautonia sociabilis]
MRARRWPVGMLLAAAVALSCWGALTLARARRDRSQLAAAISAVEAGRFEEAEPVLRRRLDDRPGDDRLRFLLGTCEQRLGRLEEAVDTWAAIDPAGAFGPRAALAASEALIGLGRLAEAERRLDLAIKAGEGDGPEPAMLRERLVQIARLTGRRDELRPLIEQVWNLALKRPPGREWPEVSSPRDLLRQYCLVDLEPPPVEQRRAELERALDRFPEDDRAWLGMAHLELEEGRLDLASGWLRRCLAARPDDPSVRLAQLRLAIAAGDSSSALEALDRLPEGALPPDRLLDLDAWFAERRGDLDEARTALRRLLERNPTDLEALERLSGLLVRLGDPAGAAELRARKAALDAAMNRYRSRYFRADLIDEGVELAGLAERLGRWFEAEGWWTLIGRSRGFDEESREALARIQERRRSAEEGPSPPTIRELIASASAGIVPGGDPEAPPPARFVEVGREVGLDFEHEPGRTPDRQLPETMSGGVALLDADGDGRLDIFAVQGGRLPGQPGLPPSSGDRLYRNRGDGTFEDVTESAGLGGDRGYGHGSCSADFDGDGHPDLLVTRLGAVSLYRNRGDGTFEDVTESAGLAGAGGWPTSAAFADIDGDGDLDLYIARYVDWNPTAPIRCRREDGSFSYCHPLALPASPDLLYRNDGGRFVDVSEEAGIRVPEAGRGLGVVALDLDDDRLIDFYVANDATANFFFRNLGDGRFEETAEMAGLAANAQGGYQAGMGIACGDLNGDGAIDLLVTNFFGEGTTYYENLGGGQFVDRSASVGLLAATRSLLGFGTALIDAQNDGRLDLLTVNGHVDDHRPRFPYAMPAQLLLGSSVGRLVPVDDPGSPPWDRPRLGRGLAVGDVDDDGRVDAVAIDQGGPLALLLNRSEGGHFLTLRLEGTRSNRDAIGATCAVVAGGLRRVAVRFGGGSYQSSSGPALHFGLGKEEWVDRIEVDWPSGLREVIEGVPADRRYRIREGEGRIREPSASPTAD